MKPLTKVTFLIDNFAVPSSGQQLVDRFLIGYNHDGEFYTPGCSVELVLNGEPTSAINSRAVQHRLRVVPSREEAIRNCQSAVVVAPSQITREVVAGLPPEARCFVYGPLADDENSARELLAIAGRRRVALRAGTAAATAFQLPPIEKPGPIRKAAIVTFGPPLEAELEGLDALWSLAPLGSGVPSVKSLQGDKVWDTAYSADWSGLFSAAFSRSNTIQGYPVRDGRTQDVVGLRLVEKLVPEPRAWLLDAGQTQIALFIMNGALEDLNIALESNSGELLSTQLYRPPAPMQDHFSNLAAQIEAFFRREETPLFGHNPVTLPGILEQMRAAGANAE
mgnify:CR=1 FL=1